MAPAFDPRHLAAVVSARPHRPGFRFILPDGYSLATVGRLFAFVCPHHQSGAVADPEAAARAAWEHAGLPVPEVLKVAVR